MSVILSDTVEVAVIVVVPAFIAFTLPLPSTVATVSSDDAQVTALLSVVFSGLYFILIFLFCPFTSDTSFSPLFNSILVRGAFTVYSHVAVLSPTFAVTVAVPGPTAVTVPLDTVTTLSFDVVHVTVLSSVVSAGSYTTVKESVCPTFRLADVLSPSKLIPFKALVFHHYHYLAL